MQSPNEHIEKYKYTFGTTFALRALKIPSLCESSPLGLRSVRIERYKNAGRMGRISTTWNVVGFRRGEHEH
jgi:hypothetical protein